MSIGKQLFLMAIDPETTYNIIDAKEARNRLNNIILQDSFFIEYMAFISRKIELAINNQINKIYIRPHSIPMYNTLMKKILEEKGYVIEEERYNSETFEETDRLIIYF